MDILFIIIACVLSAILYRAGGMDKKPETMPKWIPMWLRHSWIRDWVCSAVFLGLIILIFGWSSWWWMYLVCWALSGGALSTYWDSLFGYDNFWFHGFMCGLAGAPLIWAGVPWWTLLFRLIICTIGMGLWSKLNDIDYIEEMGRGAFFII